MGEIWNQVLEILEWILSFSSKSYKSYKKKLREADCLGFGRGWRMLDPDELWRRLW